MQNKLLFGGWMEVGVDCGMLLTNEWVWRQFVKRWLRRGKIRVLPCPSIYVT